MWNMQEGFDVGASSVDDAEVFTKASQRTVLKVALEVIRERVPDRRLDGGDHLVEALAHIVSECVVRRCRHTEPADDFGENGVRQHLAVGEHPVEVEDDEALHDSRSLRWRTIWPEADVYGVDESAQASARNPHCQRC